MSISLRDFQHVCINGGRTAWRDNIGIVPALRESRSCLAVSPTGTGKTEIFCAISRMAQKRVLILADRVELVEQTHARVERATGLQWSMEMGDRHGSRSNWFKGTVGCVPSVRKRLGKYRSDEFGLIVVDEADLGIADSYRDIYDHFKEAKVLGVTATPNRRDKVSLEGAFETLAFEYRLPEAIEDGWLIEPTQLVRVWTEVNLADVRGKGESMNQGQVSKRVGTDKAVLELVGETLRIADSRPTIIFAQDIAQAEAIADKINDHREGSAFAASCKTEDRKRSAMIAEWKRGGFQFFVNVNIATRGLDHPPCSLVVNGAPTGSWPRFMQRMGRGTRPLAGTVDGHAGPEARKAAIAASGKPDFVFLDFTDVSDRHDLVHPDEALAGEPLSERDRRCLAEVRREGRLMTAREAIAKAKRMAKEQEEEIERIKEASRPKLLVTTRGQYRAPQRGENPVQLGERGNFSLTPKQIARLTQQKYPVDGAGDHELRGFWKDYVHRIKSGRPSRAMENFVKSFGVPCPESRNAAASLLDRLIAQRRARNVEDRR